MSFGSFVCQNNIKFQQKQPVVALYLPMCQKKQNRFNQKQMVASAYNVI